MWALPDHYKITLAKMEEYESNHPSDRQPDTLEMAKVHAALFLGEKLEEVCFALTNQDYNRRG